MSLQDPGSIFAEELVGEMSGSRVAFATTLGGLPVDPEVQEIVENQRKVFEELGCIVEEACPISTVRTMSSKYYVLSVLK